MEVVNDPIREIKYKDELTKLYPNAADQESRWASVEEVVNAWPSYSRRESERRPTSHHRRLLAGGRPDGR